MTRPPPPPREPGAARDGRRVLWTGLALLALASAAAGALILWRPAAPTPPTAAVAPALPTPPPSMAPPAAAPAVAVAPPLPPAIPAPAPDTGRLRAAPCPALGLSGPAPRCATLSAPQDWSTGAGPVVEVFVTVLPAAGPTAERDPVLVLSGGPGQAGSSEAAALEHALVPLRARRDVILVDQRGAGASIPALRCPGIGAATFWYGGLSAAAVKDCLDPVRRQGFHLESFDTGQAARDLAALRRALGVERWNVIATSYGAVLAQALLRLDGDGVRALVLNSPTTADATWLDRERFAETRRVFQQLAEDCAAQPGCARSFPGMADAVPRLARTLAAQPVVLRLDGPATWRLGWDAVVSTIGFRLGTGGGAVAVPALLDGLERMASGKRPADPAVLGEILLPEGFRRVFDRLAYGLNLVIGCRENRPRIDAAAARKAAADSRPYAAPDAVETDYDVACPALALTPVDAAFYRPVPSEAPALILTGAYDTLVPEARVAELARSLPHATRVNFRGLGHDVLGASACAAGMVAGFLDDLGRHPPVQCAERFLPPAFQTTPFGG